mmetsp:Transcript_46046/g.111520  ORF Transcript_46046/g.111520 Transcript_46046/m.111520 type:complete len:95 (-) Transcript_46046:359-643(-)
MNAQWGSLAGASIHNRGRGYCIACLFASLRGEGSDCAFEFGQRIAHAFLGWFKLSIDRYAEDCLHCVCVRVKTIAVALRLLLYESNQSIITALQ